MSYRIEGMTDDEWMALDLGIGFFLIMCYVGYKLFLG